MNVILLYAVMLFFSAHAIAEENDVYNLIEQHCAVPTLYAPWRKSYSFLQAKKSVSQEEKKKCPFCREMQEHDDERYFILRRFTYNLVALNIFPYAKGHLLIIPLEHKSHLKELSCEARTEMMELATCSLEILEQVYHVAGANVGFNIGTIAGASVVDHLHMHIVPRSIIPSFMQMIGKTEVINFELKDVYNDLKKFFDTIEVRYLHL